MKLQVVEITDPVYYSLKNDTARKNEEGEGGVEEKDQMLCLDLPRSATIMDVKSELVKLLGGRNECLRVFFRGKEMRDDCYLSTSLIGDERLVFTRYDEFNNLEVCGLESLASLSDKSQTVLQKLMAQIREGLQVHPPELSSDGSGGTYFLRNAEGKKIACFKPQDEEPGAINNPRGYTPNGNNEQLRKGIRVGEAVQREVAAFITDTKNFSSVPETIMVEAVHENFHYATGAPMVPKVGSLQRYVDADSMASDFSPSLFPVDEVHKIGILDIRLLNADRNDGNILVIRGEEGFELIPIDHGYCLPDRLEVTWCDWCWLDWPQTRQPFSEETKEWIRNYDIEANVDKLRRELNIREACLDLMRIAGLVLKRGVEAGLCLHDIATILVRQDLDCESVLESQIIRAKDLEKMMLRNSRVKGFSAQHNHQHNNPKKPLLGRFARRATLSSVELPEFSSGRVKLAADPPPKLHRLGHIANVSSDSLCSSIDLEDDYVMIHHAKTISNPELPPRPTKSKKQNVVTNGDDEDEDYQKDQEVAHSRPRFIRVNSVNDDVVSSTSTSTSSLFLSDKENDEPTDFEDLLNSSAPMPPLRPVRKQKRHTLDDAASIIEKAKQALMNSGKTVQNLLQTGDHHHHHHQTPSSGGKIFYEYLERLIDDVFECIHQHRQRDKSLFRRSSSLHLTSPHRKLRSSSSGSSNSNGILRPRGHSAGSFFNSDDCDIKLIMVNDLKNIDGPDEPCPPSTCESKTTRSNAKPKPIPPRPKLTEMKTFQPKPDVTQGINAAKTKPTLYPTTTAKTRKKPTPIIT